jgi:hypothetical protein
MVYMLIAVFALAMAGVGGGLWYAMQTGAIEQAVPRPGVPGAAGGEARPTDRPTVPGATPPPVESHGRRAPAWEAFPLLQAEPMAATTWELIEEEYHYAYRPSDAWLTDQARVFTEAAEEHFVSSVVTDAAGVITSATVHLTLVNDRAISVAKTSIPVALFGRDRRQRLRVPMPEGLGDGLLHVDGWVEVHQRLPEAVYLSQTRADRIAEVEAPVLVVRGVNMSERTLSLSVFVLTAADSRGRMLARWRVEVPQEVEPRGSVEFRARLTPPLPGETIANWAVEAAGH